MTNSSLIIDKKMVVNGEEAVKSPTNMDPKSATDKESPPIT